MAAEMRCHGQCQFGVNEEHLREAMKIPKLFYAFAVFTCAAIYAVYVKWNLDFKTKDAALDLENQLDRESSQTDQSVFYGIMFDAGSTGTRVHVFKFSQKPKEIPKLIHTTFKALQPGLSAYADDADKVKDVFQESPFLVSDDCVSIMDGTYEGISAWITVNFLTGRLNAPGKKSVGMLDLGGGSIQITFRLSTETTLKRSSTDRITSFQLFNSTYQLYSYSYLGLGLMSARLAILGGVEGEALKEGEILASPCLSPDFQGEWEHTKIMYKIKGQKAEMPLFESCSDEIAKLLSKKVHETDEVKDLDFYAFSYYYDLAVDAGLIDGEKGGTLAVGDFETAAKNVCKSMEVQRGEHPFLCMDLTYISLLLEELGFPKSHTLALARKINNTETSWALGAILHYMDSLHKLQY
nr:ectonucleoside triphosphate diphosphohydrolase 6 [Pogona vitticeps]